MQDTTKDAGPKKKLQDAIVDYIAINKGKLSKKLLGDLESLNDHLNSGASVLLVCGKLFSWERDVKRENSEKKAADEAASPLKRAFKSKVVFADNPDDIIFAIGQTVKDFAFVQTHIIHLLEEYKKIQASSDKQEQITAIQSKVLFYTEEEQLFKVVIAGLNKFKESAAADKRLAGVIFDLEGYRDQLSSNKAKLSKSSPQLSDTESSHSRSGRKTSSSGDEETSSGSASPSPTNSRVIDEVGEDYQAFENSINEELKVEAEEAAAKLAHEEAERKATEEREKILKQDVIDFQESIDAEMEEDRIAEETRTRLAREEAERVAAKAAEERVVALQQEVNDFQDSITAEIEEDRAAEENRARLAQEEAERLAAEAERAAKEEADRVAAEAERAAKEAAEKIAAEKATAEFHAKFGSSFFPRFYEEADKLAKLDIQKKAERLAELKKQELLQEVDKKIQAKEAEITKITQMMATTEYKEAELVRAQELQRDIKLTRERMAGLPEKEVKVAVNYLTEKLESERTENPRNLARLQAELANLENHKAFVLGDKSVIEKLRARQQELTQQIASQEELIGNTEQKISDFRQTSEQRKKIITDTLEYRLGMQRNHLVSKHAFKKADIEAYEKTYTALDEAGRGALVEKAAKKWWDYIPFVRSREAIELAYRKRQNEVGMLFRFASQIDDISSGLKDFSRPNIEQEVADFNNLKISVHNSLVVGVRDGVVPEGSLPYEKINVQNIASLVSDHESFRLNRDEFLPAQRKELRRLYSDKYAVEHQLNVMMSLQPTEVSVEQTTGLRQ